MKKLFSVFLLFTTCLSAQEKPSEPISFKTSDNKVFTNVKVSKIWPDGISVITSDGVQKVTLEKLPPEMAAKYELTQKAADDWRTTQATEAATNREKIAAIEKEKERADKVSKKKEKVEVIDESSKMAAHWELFQKVEGGSLCFYGDVTVTPDTRRWSLGHVVGGQAPVTRFKPLHDEAIFIYGFGSTGSTRSGSETGSGWLYPAKSYTYTNLQGKTRTVSGYRIIRTPGAW